MSPTNIKLLIESIFKECQKHFNPDFHKVMWHNRCPDNVLTRGAIMYGLRLTDSLNHPMPFDAIGRCFTKRRPHSTVLMNIRNFESLSYDESRPLYGLRINIDILVSGEGVESAIAYHERELERLKKLQNGR